jgi:RES domain-containing protein
VIVWRISSYRDLSGVGGLRASNRWNTIGRSIVYTSDHPAAALNEMLVSFDFEDLPDPFQLLKISIPSSVTVRKHNPKIGWSIDTLMTRSVGDKWLQSNASAVLRVPSAIMPHSYNYLLNPLHPDAKKFRILASQFVSLDDRLKQT